MYVWPCVFVLYLLHLPRGEFPASFPAPIRLKICNAKCQQKHSVHTQINKYLYTCAYKCCKNIFQSSIVKGNRTDIFWYLFSPLRAAHQKFWCWFYSNKKNNVGPYQNSFFNINSFVHFNEYVNIAFFLILSRRNRNVPHLFNCSTIFCHLNSKAIYKSSWVWNCGKFKNFLFCQIFWKSNKV